MLSCYDSFSSNFYSSVHIVLKSVSLTRVVSSLTMMKMRQLDGKEYCRLILYVFRILTETSIYNI